MEAEKDEPLHFPHFSQTQKTKWFNFSWEHLQTSIRTLYQLFPIVKAVYYQRTVYAMTSLCILPSLRSSVCQFENLMTSYRAL